MKAITTEWLRANDACDEEIELFAMTFGESAEVSRANARRAAHAGLNIDWLAGKLLDDAAFLAYSDADDAAFPAYREAKAALLRAYWEAKAALLRAYREAKAAARRAYWEAADAALRACIEANGAALRAYREAEAMALCDALGLPAEDPVMAVEGQVCS